MIKEDLDLCDYLFDYRAVDLGRGDVITVFATSDRLHYSAVPGAVFCCYRDGIVDRVTKRNGYVSLLLVDGGIQFTLVYPIANTENDVRLVSKDIEGIMTDEELASVEERKANAEKQKKAEAKAKRKEQKKELKRKRKRFESKGGFDYYPVERYEPVGCGDDGESKHFEGKLYVGVDSYGNVVGRRKLIDRFVPYNEFRADRVSYDLSSNKDYVEDYDPDYVDEDYKPDAFRDKLVCTNVSRSGSDGGSFDSDLPEVMFTLRCGDYNEGTHKFEDALVFNVDRDVPAGSLFVGHYVGICNNYDLCDNDDRELSFKFATRPNEIDEFVRVNSFRDLHYEGSYRCYVDSSRGAGYFIIDKNRHNLIVLSRVLNKKK